MVNIYIRRDYVLQNTATHLSWREHAAKQQFPRVVHHWAINYILLTNRLQTVVQQAVVARTQYSTIRIRKKWDSDLKQRYYKDLLKWSVKWMVCERVRDQRHWFLRQNDSSVARVFI